MNRESYNFNEIEKKWQEYWKTKKTFRTENNSQKPKYYVLDMFPYPSGAGLHVGHPLGYIASDIVARYKRLKGFNVLHPMGFDSFGLPAEQYAIQTGQHPAITTAENITRYRKQLESLGFSFDWDREVQTSDPAYYKWTQWIFLRLFESWYDRNAGKARPVAVLIAEFEKNGNGSIEACHNCETEFSSAEWRDFDNAKKSEILLRYRLAYLDDTVVNWCPELGTVLANDEVKDGLSERGGYPVFQKKMRQWMMRITAYADRLEEGLDRLDWPASVKEMQRNWIGRSEGATVVFSLEGRHETIEVFTTRPDTIFGVSFIALSPEHELASIIATAVQRDDVKAFIDLASRKTERERMAGVETAGGIFTGARAIHPFTGEKLEVWIADYVLAGYGSGAVMGVPSGDQRDWNLAKNYSLPMIQVIDKGDITAGATEEKDVRLINSDFLTGMKSDEAIAAIIKKLEEKKIGKGRLSYRMRDAVFSRQRYWGEPVPVYFNKGIPMALPEQDLPLELPRIDRYLPTEEGEPPLARAKNWLTREGHQLETNTMPGWAGSSWYFLRYTDPKNDAKPFSSEAVNYWQNVDFYIGGAEHATGHLLYARFWTMFLSDCGLIPFDEPFLKLLNQGMIQGRSAVIHRFNAGYISREDGQVKSRETNLYLSKSYAEKLAAGEITPKEIVAKIDERYGKGFAKKNELVSNIFDVPKPTRIHVDIGLVNGDEVEVHRLKEWQPRFRDAIFLFEEGEKFLALCETEKMSKTKFNVINPDDLVKNYGADTLRCYEMFLGPVEQHKPWDTKGIEGVHRFLRKFWNLFYTDGLLSVSEESPDGESEKALHRFLKKVEDDISRLSFNTVVSECMILCNKLAEQKCRSRKVLEAFVIALSPYAPHICEEIWQQLGHTGSVSIERFPAFDERLLKDLTVKYPVSFNGKVRFTLEVDANMDAGQLKSMALGHEMASKWLEGKEPKKVIVVPGRIVNIVV